MTESDPKKSWIGRVLDWVRDNFAWVVLAMLGAGAGYAFLRRRDSAVNTIGGAVEIDRALRDVQRLESTRRELQAAGDTYRETDMVLARQIAQKKREVAALHKGESWEKMSDAEVVAALRDLGL